MFGPIGIIYFHVRNLYNGKILRNEDMMLPFLEIGMLLNCFLQSYLTREIGIPKKSIQFGGLENETFPFTSWQVTLFSTPWLLAFGSPRRFNGCHRIVALFPSCGFPFFPWGGSKWMAWFFEGIEVCQGFKECFYEI